MPLSAPRQPAWAAATTRACASANSTGAQSAVSTPSAIPGVAVTMASAFGRSSERPRLADDKCCRAVHLVGRGEIARAQMRRHAGPVLPHRGRIVPGADAAVEACIDARRHAAMPREEAVRNACQVGKAGSQERFRHLCPSRTAAAEEGAGERTAITLKSPPMPPGEINRCTAASISPARPGVGGHQPLRALDDAETPEKFGLRDGAMRRQGPRRGLCPPRRQTAHERSGLPSPARRADRCRRGGARPAACRRTTARQGHSR